MMNSLLQSSLIGQDFIKYRKHNSNAKRKIFSQYVHSSKLDHIPIVIDSVDTQLSQLLHDISRSNLNEFHFHKDMTVAELVIEIKAKINFKLDTKWLKLGLENGSILDSHLTLDTLYKKYAHDDDNILYLLLTQESSLYLYLLSLIKYIFFKH